MSLSKILYYAKWATILENWTKKLWTYEWIARIVWICEVAGCRGAVQCGDLWSSEPLLLFLCLHTSNLRCSTASVERRIVTSLQIYICHSTHWTLNRYHRLDFDLGDWLTSWNSPRSLHRGTNGSNGTTNPSKRELNMGLLVRCLVSRHVEFEITAGRQDPGVWLYSPDSSHLSADLPTSSCPESQLIWAIVTVSFFTA